MAFRYQISQVRELKDRMLPTARKATVAVGALLKADLTVRLQALKHAQSVGAVFNLQGEPRPHLWQTTNAKTIIRSDGKGYVALVGCRKTGAHISIINSGTAPRTREAREFFVPLTSSLSLLGSRAGGTKGIAGRYVLVELRIRNGTASADKRTTGTGPELAVLAATYSANTSQIRQTILDTFNRELSNVTRNNSSAPF
jgi:hypothetical protein